MQLKMEESKSVKFNKKKLRKELKDENDYIYDLLTTFDVPDSVEDEELQNMYLLDTSKDKSKSVSKLNEGNRAQSGEDLENLRLEIMNNKRKSKKTKMSQRTIKKREMKKLKKDKEFKKKLVSVNKALKNEKVKEDKLVEETKENVKKIKPIFNQDGKMVFSKFDFASHPGAKAKKSKKEKYEKNPKKILQNIKQENKKINELIEKGEEDKAKELKQEIAWQKAFDKTEGKKVKDDPNLLYKSIKKRKLQKKKSKNEWVDRKKKVEQDIAARQKKRQENIDKRNKEKKVRKLKRLAKRGKVIPGF